MPKLLIRDVIACLIMQLLREYTFWPSFLHIKSLLVVAPGLQAPKATAQSMLPPAWRSSRPPSPSSKPARSQSSVTAGPEPSQPTCRAKFSLKQQKLKPQAALQHP